MVTESRMIIGCSPVARLPVPLPGSGTATCDLCGAAVWVAPTTLAVIRQLQQVPIFTCFPGCTKQSGAVIDIPPPTKAQLAEIVAAFEERRKR